MKNFISVFFIVPFFSSAVNLQDFSALFLSETYAQIIAYANLALVLAGSFLILREKDFQPLPMTIKLWLYFLGFYYCFGLIGNVVSDFYPNLVKTVIPLIYFLVFTLYLNRQAHQNKFRIAVIFTFFICNVLVIYLQSINFSFDYSGIYEYTLERAGGVYGDANNAAVVCLLGFVFTFESWHPKKKIGHLMKWVTIAVALYALILTFSKTGFLVLVILLGIISYKHFHLKTILLGAFLFPLFLVVLVKISQSDVLSQIQSKRIEDITNILMLNTENVSYSGRDALFNNMLNKINENPLLGYGIGYSSHIRGHNTIFGVWADVGIIGFIFFLTLLLKYLISILTLTSENKKYLLLGMFIILVVFMLSLQTIINQPYLIVLFVYMSYLIKVDKEEDPYLLETDESHIYT